MDRSFLSQPPVVAASKNFVCIRLTSYEDETEKAFVATLVREVANTAFAILSPDGKPITGRGRGPGNVYSDAADMAKGMDAIAAKYETKKVEGTPALPITLNLTVGLAVAAGDNQPLVVVLSPDPTRRKDLEARVAEQAWSKTFCGYFTYASGPDLKGLPKLKGATRTEGVLVIEPDLFGAGGQVFTEVPADQIAEKLPAALKLTLRSFVPLAKTRRELANLGLKEGIFYETGIPVSGKGEAADRERYKQLLEKKK